MTVVVIMAGGLGKRMNSELPKVLHDVSGLPMLVRVIQTALMLSPTKIYIVVGKYSQIIKEYLIKYEIMDSVEFIFQEQALGTGHAIQCCYPYLYESLSINQDKKVLILSGDVPLIQPDLLRGLLDSCDENCIASIMTTQMSKPHGYGRIIQEDGVFKKIAEEKDCNDLERNCKIVNAGIYVFDVEYLCEYIFKLDTNNAQKEYYLTDIFEIILHNEPNKSINTHQVPYERQYELEGVNTKEQLDKMNNLLNMLK